MCNVNGFAFGPFWVDTGNYGAVFCYFTSSPEQRWQKKSSSRIPPHPQVLIRGCVLKALLRVPFLMAARSFHGRLRARPSSRVPAWGCEWCHSWGLYGRRHRLCWKLHINVLSFPTRFCETLVGGPLTLYGSPGGYSNGKEMMNILKFCIMMIYFLVL